MKRKILFAFLMACVGLMLASCEKEECIGDNTGEETSLLTETVVEYPLRFTNLSKRWVDNYESYVYVKSGGGSTFVDGKKYRTIRLRNLEETIIQEWLL